jgi:uncharacterized RDD family membrane protein YckC
MTHERILAVRRVLAFGLDWCVIAAWAGVLLGAVMLAAQGYPPRPATPWASQVIGLLTMTIPVTLYFATCEASRWHGSLGKHVLGLVVTHESGERLSFGSALLRNGLKFVPWEFGHLVAQQAVYSGDAGLPVWVWGAAIVALAVPAWWGVTLIATGHTPYDRWTSTRVVVQRFDVR